MFSCTDRMEQSISNRREALVRRRPEAAGERSRGMTVDDQGGSGSSTSWPCCCAIFGRGAQDHGAGSVLCRGLHSPAYYDC